MTAEHVLEDALAVIHRTGPEYGPYGLSNHAPMAVDAILALDRPGQVMAWLEEYAKQLDPAPPRGLHPIAAASSDRSDGPDSWREALGRQHRVADWQDFFEREIAERGWRGAIALWTPRLAPGFAAAAAHGLLRTAHAARGLSVAATPARERELAHGFAYWASTWSTLPGNLAADAAPVRASDALPALPHLGASELDRAGSISGNLARLDSTPQFVDSVNAAAPDGADDVSAFLSDLTAAAATAYLRHDHDLIAFVHGVTGPSALRLLLPYLRPADQVLAARYAWQTCAAILTWYGDPADEPAAPPAADNEDDRIDPDELTERALSAAGPHTIKLTEACLREHNLSLSPVYLSTAADAPDRVGPI